MQLTVLGGSAASPGPGQGCSSYLVEADGFRLVLDTGPNTLAELRRQTSLDRIDAIVISHLHSDHTIDLVPLRYGLKYAPSASGRSLPLWMPPDGINFLNNLADVFAIGAESNQSFFRDVFDIAEYDPERELQLGPLAITFSPTRHFVPCWAMRLSHDGRSLVYLADTGPFEPLARFAASADLLICEATLPAGSEGSGENGGHLTASQAGQLAASSGARRLLLTHMWPEFDVNEAVRAASETFGGTVIAAKPGLELEF